MFEPTLNLFSRNVSTVGSKRWYHNSLVCVAVVGRDSCWLFIYSCSEALNKQFSSSPREPHSPPNSDKPGPLYSSAATLARFFHVKIF